MLPALKRTFTLPKTIPPLHHSTAGIGHFFCFLLFTSLFSIENLNHLPMHVTCLRWTMHTLPTVPPRIYTYPRRHSLTFKYRSEEWVYQCLIERLAGSSGFSWCCQSEHVGAAQSCGRSWDDLSVRTMDPIDEWVCEMYRYHHQVSEA